MSTQLLTTNLINISYGGDAITAYMEQHGDVAIKVGWRKQKPAEWEEPYYDAIYREVCPDSTLSFLYAKAGLLQKLNPKVSKKESVGSWEGCPYTAYEKDHRYTLQTEQYQDIDRVCMVNKLITSHWLSAITACGQLEEILGPDILPPNCMQGANKNKWVHKALNHWANQPLQERGG
jgi:hypothetical protein